MVDYGAGEILLTSMDKDGTKSGFDLELTRAISDSVMVPVIASGGVGKLQDLTDGIKLGHADAVLAASIFHFGEHTVGEAKQQMASKVLRFAFNMSWLDQVKWNEDGLAPVITQEIGTNQVLTLAWMNRASLRSPSKQAMPFIGLARARSYGIRVNIRPPAAR